jgi:hypothetical protein
MRVTTVKSEQIWQSPDGKRTIWEVTLQGAPGEGEYRLKTYSEVIAKEGWSGEVEDYLNPKGEKFVRQPKHDFTGNPGRGGNYQPRDDDAIRAQWSIGRAVDTIDWKDPELDLAHVLTVVERRANAFYDLVYRVKAHGDKGGES